MSVVGSFGTRDFFSPAKSLEGTKRSAPPQGTLYVRSFITTQESEFIAPTLYFPRALALQTSRGLKMAPGLTVGHHDLEQEQRQEQQRLPREPHLLRRCFWLPCGLIVRGVEHEQQEWEGKERRAACDEKGARTDNTFLSFRRGAMRRRQNMCGWDRARAVLTDTITAWKDAMAPGRRVLEGPPSWRGTLKSNLSIMHSWNEIAPKVEKRFFPAEAVRSHTGRCTT